MRLKQTLDSFAGPLRNSRRLSSPQTQFSALTVQSTNPIVLDPLPATAAELVSTEQINTTPTSYSTRGPEFSGGTTSRPTLSGTYDGSNGTDTLTFSVVASGVLGLQRDLEVRDSQGGLIDSFNLPTFSQAATFSLSNGLSLDLTAGSFEVGDSFDVTVYDSVGETPRLDNPFNGTRDNSPWLQSGFTVTDGQFELNGVIISVSASDSINSVLGRINSSAAGVTASFDGATERIQLTQQTTGSAPTISFGVDTSGFLVATKLDGAVVVDGTDSVSGDQRALDQVSMFSSVQSGALSINDSSIAFDVQNDSLAQIIDRINLSDAGAEAALDTSPRFSIRSANPLQALVIGSDATGLLNALQISDGIYAPVERTSSQSRSAGPRPKQIRTFASDLRELADRINRLYADVAEGGYEGAYAEKLRSAIEQAVGITSDRRSIRVADGIRIDFGSGGKQVVQLGQRDRLQRSIKKNVGDINAVFFGSGNSGLIAKLDRIASGAISELNSLLSQPGGIVNQRA